MIQRLNSDNNPHLFLLHYNAALRVVQNLLVVPKYFFLPEMIAARRPLSPMACRAGWVGCKINLWSIPDAGRIALIENGVARARDAVREDWRKTQFLSEQATSAARGWLLSVMRCVERIGKPEFALSDVYQFESELAVHYPTNRYIRQKSGNSFRFCATRDI